MGTAVIDVTECARVDATACERGVTIIKQEYKPTKSQKKVPPRSARLEELLKKGDSITESEKKELEKE